MKEEDIAVLKYMKLRVDGVGIGLTREEISLINGIPDQEWESVTQAILDLGGTVP